jgi:hypothetical protein
LDFPLVRISAETNRDEPNSFLGVALGFQDVEDITKSSGGDSGSIKFG